MNLHDKQIRIAFSISLVMAILWMVLFPTVKLSYFAPFLIIVFYQKKLVSSLWYALLCGLIIDILSPQTRFALHALTFCVTSAVIYPQRRHFFADNISTLPIMTFLFSLTSTAIYFVLVNMYQTQLAISLQWIFTDLILMPAADSLYGFTLFLLPFLLIGKRPKKGKEYFL